MNVKILMVAGIIPLAFALSGCQPDFASYISMDKLGKSFSCNDLLSRYESKKGNLRHMYGVLKLEREGRHYFKQCREALDKRHHGYCLSIAEQESVFMRKDVSDANRKFCSDEIAKAKANKVKEISSSGNVLLSNEFDKVISKGFIQEKGSSRQYRVAEIVSITAPESLLDGHFYRVYINFSSQDVLEFIFYNKDAALKYVEHVKNNS